MMSAFFMESPIDTVKESGLESENSSDEEDTHSIFQAIKEKIDRNEVDLRDREKLEKFAHKYGDYLGDSTSEEHDKKTLLHLLVDGATDQNFDKYEPLAKFVISNHPNTLKESDRVDETSLYCAVSKKRNELVRLMCNTHPDINSVLERVCSSNKETCIHAAIRKSVTPEIAVFLINKASKEVLCLQDTQGNTPLHLAVEYKRCTKEQLQVVETLAKRCKGAMYKRSKGEACLSPYLYHMRTRAEAQAAPVVTEVAKEKRKGNSQRKIHDINVVDRDSLIGKDGEGGNLKTNYTEELKALGPSVGFSRQRKPTLGKPPMSPLGAFNQTSSMRHGPLSPSFGVPRSGEWTQGSDELPRDRKDGYSRTLSRQDTISKKSEKPRKRKKQENNRLPKVTDASADAVKDLLMLHCMRTMKTEDAEDFLYGKDQGEFPRAASW